MMGNKILALWKRHVLEPLLAYCGQEAPAEAIALCVALGLALGVCPVVGCPTIFCALAAILLRVNLPAIQFVNYLASPLQLTLLVPFIRLGGWLFRGDRAGYNVVTAALHSMVAWFCVCAPAGLLVYGLLLFVLRRYRVQPAAEETKRLCPTLP
jgi:uncharacterized protein (DUF2062 family)